MNAHTPFNRRAIVHEATHAIQDSQLSGKTVWRLDDEATAYIAEWLFVLHASTNRDRLISKPDPNDAIEVTALEIARTLADKPGASPDPAAMRRLGDAIFYDPNYSVTMVLHPWITRRRRHQGRLTVKAVAPHATRISRKLRLSTLPLALRGSAPSRRRNVSGTL